MKTKFLAVIAFLFAAAVTTACAQGVATYKVPNPNYTTSGSYTQPSNYVSSNPAGVTQIWPWYTKLDSILNTGADTFRCKLYSSNSPSTVTSWVHVTSISGTNTSCKIKLWATADSAKGVDWKVLDSVTVNNVNPQDFYIFNSGNGFPYTNFMWTFQGAGTHQTSWYSGLLIK